MYQCLVVPYKKVDFQRVRFCNWPPTLNSSYTTEVLHQAVPQLLTGRLVDLNNLEEVSVP